MVISKKKRSSLRIELRFIYFRRQLQVSSQMPISFATHSLRNPAVRYLSQEHNRLVRVSFEPKPCRSQSRRSNHSTTLPTIMNLVFQWNRVRVSRRSLRTRLQYNHAYHRSSQRSSKFMSRDSAIVSLICRPFFVLRNISKNQPKSCFRKDTVTRLALFERSKCN